MWSSISFLWFILQFTNFQSAYNRIKSNINWHICVLTYSSPSLCRIRISHSLKYIEVNIESACFIHVRSNARLIRSKIINPLELDTRFGCINLYTNPFALSQCNVIVCETPTRFCLSHCSVIYIWLFGIATPSQTHKTSNKFKNLKF